MLYEGGVGIEGMRAYMITVIAAATISTVIVKITDKQGSNASVIRALTGIFLAISIVSPVLKISFEPVTDLFDNVKAEADHITNNASDLKSEKEAIIKKTLEAYILDKAGSLGLSVDVCLEVNDDLTPACVSLSGNASPYAKRQLQAYITETLGIPREAQSWN